MTLYGMVVEKFPNADVWWSGRPNEDGAVVTWFDTVYCVTPDHDEFGERVYLIGVYPVTVWTDGGDATTYYEVQDAVDVVALLDRLTDEQVVR